MSWVFFSMSSPKSSSTSFTFFSNRRTGEHGHRDRYTRNNNNQCLAQQQWTALFCRSFVLMNQVMKHFIIINKTRRRTVTLTFVFTLQIIWITAPGTLLNDIKITKPNNESAEAASVKHFWTTVKCDLSISFGDGAQINFTAVHITFFTCLTQSTTDETTYSNRRGKKSKRGSKIPANNLLVFQKDTRKTNPQKWQLKSWNH